MRSAHKWAHTSTSELVRLRMLRHTCSNYSLLEVHCQSMKYAPRQNLTVTRGLRYGGQNSD